MLGSFLKGFFDYFYNIIGGTYYALGEIHKSEKFWILMGLLLLKSFLWALVFYVWFVIAIMLNMIFHATVHAIKSMLGLHPKTPVKYY